MTEDTFDGTWTLIVGDEEANPKTNTRIVVDGSRAWDAASPHQIGTCTIADDTMTIVLNTRSANGPISPETIIARLSDRRALSGVIQSGVAGDVALCEPCLLIRKMSLSFRAPASRSAAVVSSHAA